MSPQSKAAPWPGIEPRFPDFQPSMLPTATPSIQESMTKKSTTRTQSFPLSKQNPEPANSIQENSELQMKALRLQVAFVPKNVYIASSI